MSRWASNPEAAADALIGRALEAIDLSGRILLANQGGALPTRLAERGVAPVLWNRRADTIGQAQPWPPAGPFDAALLRLAKARDERDMAAHACLGALAPGGQLVLWGGNDEGIRSAAGALARLCGSVDTLAVGGHGRVLATPRHAGPLPLRASLEAWRTVAELQIGASTRPWVSYPGIFAAGRIDEGTGLLLGVLPQLKAGARVLDYGCGSGVIGATLLASEATLRLDLMDNDTVALEAARENVPAARTVLGTGLADLAGATYGAILSNPPLHRGIAEDHALLNELIAGAPSRLAPGGLLQIVVQRRIALERLLARHFATVTVAAETGRFRVWRAFRG